MASACVNKIGMPPESFLDCNTVKCPSYGWLSPRISFSRDFPDEDASKAASAESSNPDAEETEVSDPEVLVKDFEFRLEDPVKMLPADELFSDGKLMPLYLSTIRQTEVEATEASKFCRRNEISYSDPYLFSPKAPRCSSHWKELLGLKKLYQNSNNNSKTTTPMSSHNRNVTKTVKHFLRRGGSKSALTASIDSSSLSLPLLKETEYELLCNDDLPRLSLDSDKPDALTRNTHQHLPKVRAVKHRPPVENTRVCRSPVRESTVAIDSPRMISSGKIVFHGLERSSSSPSSLNGAQRYNNRGMERSYSGNVVRVSPVLNVPVCSLRGSGVFGLPLFSSQQKHQNKNRTDRT